MQQIRPSLGFVTFRFVSIKLFDFDFSFLGCRKKDSIQIINRILRRGANRKNEPTAVKQFIPAKDASDAIHMHIRVFAIFI